MFNELCLFQLPATDADPRLLPRVRHHAQLPRMLPAPRLSAIHTLVVHVLCS